MYVCMISTERFSLYHPQSLFQLLRFSISSVRNEIPRAKMSSSV